jgi:hypothetical protein
MGDKSSNKKNTYISYSYVKLPEGKYNIMQSLLLLHRKNTVSGKDAEFWDDFFPHFRMVYETWGSPSSKWRA